jgi:diguanylate cyclase (GGDEF)-like protein
MGNAVGVAGQLPASRPGNHRITRAARRSYVALAVGLAVVALFVVVRNAAPGPWVYLVAGCYGTALSVLGAIRMPGPLRRSWLAFAVCQLLYLAGDCAWTLYDNILHINPYPSPADALYLVMYPVLAFGMWSLVRAHGRGRDRAAFLDAAILTTGATVIGVVFFVVPAAESNGGSLVGQVMAAAYPVGDLLLLAIAFRLLTDGTARNMTLWAILGSVATLLVVDVYYDLAVLSGAPYPTWIDCGFLLSYLLLGFASLHPSARRLSEPAPDRTNRITLGRLSLLGVALLLAPATGLVAYLTGVRHAPWTVFVGGSVAALLVVVRLWDLVRDLQCKASELATLAGRDGLTGVANRRTWDQELSRACAFAGEHRAPLTMAVLDLDHFKEFNDRHGHLAGDAVLKETAAAWSSILGDRGFLARFGGEEFTVLLPHLGASEARLVLERMRRAVTHGQSCSIGVATWDGAEPLSGLMARADQALYRAKGAGRDRMAVHEDGRITVMTPSSYANPALASLRTVYQPIQDLRTGEVVGVEALSRFDGLDPRTVFDSAERDGTAPALEAGAIAAAIGGWDRAGLLALNVSLSTLVTPAVQAALPDDLTSLVLEITEADMVDYGPEVMLAVREARARGALIAIDDFGAGFSNTHRVAKIAPDIVKIDMSLVRGIDGDPLLQAVVTACLRYTELTSTRLIAEGIETDEELDCLVGLGVRLGQGYLLGVPGPLPAPVG